MPFSRPAALRSAAFLLVALVAPAALPAPAAAEPATAAQQAEAAKFIQDLSGEAFLVLKDKSLSKEAARAKFRDLLRANFAIDQIGMRLIRKHRAGLSPAQLSAYRAALPDFIVNTYSDRLYDFASSTVTVVRQIPRGSQGHVDVVTRVSDPAGGKPIDAAQWLRRARGLHARREVAAGHHARRRSFRSRVRSPLRPCLWPGQGA